jgi:hypothetical protein
MPLYNISTTSTALGIPSKWLDNLLSHNKIDGVEQAKQGVQRRLSLEAVTVIAVTHRLVEGTGIPVGRAVALAERLFLTPGHSITIADTVTFTIDRTRLEKTIFHELERAVEVTPLPARGRPISASGGGDLRDESKQGAQ